MTLMRVEMPAPVALNPVPARPAPQGKLANAIAAAKAPLWFEYRTLLATFSTATPTQMSRLVTLAGELNRDSSAIEADATVVAKATALGNRLDGRDEAMTAKANAIKRFEKAQADRDGHKEALRTAERAVAAEASLMNLAFARLAEIEDAATKLRELRSKHSALLSD